MSDTKKDVLVGGAGVVAAAALTGTGPIGAAAMAIPTLIGVGFNAIKSADQKRAEKLLERMVGADEDPTDFVDALNSRLAKDPEVVAAFRALMVASIESVALAAIEPIALVGRQHLRGTCPAWAARSWLRVLAELAEDELGMLRTLVLEAVRRRDRIEDEDAKSQGPGRGFAATGQQHPRRTPIRLRLHRDHQWESSLTLSFRHSVMLFHNDPPPRFDSDAVNRLWQLLNQNHLGMLVPDREQLERERKAEENRAERRTEYAERTDRRSVGRVQYSMFDEVREHSELFQFHDVAFDVIAKAFPLPDAK